MIIKAPKNIRCYDNGGETIDRYTVIYLEFLESLPDTYQSVGMNATPFHSQGFGQHCAAKARAGLSDAEKTALQNAERNLCKTQS